MQKFLFSLLLLLFTALTYGNTSATLIPDIHSGCWPNFCIHHLRSDPEGCSQWTLEERSLQLEFTLSGSSSCQIDRGLIERLGDSIYLIPQRFSGYNSSCDHAFCSACQHSVAHSVSCKEVCTGPRGEPHYSCTLFYKCICTDDWLTLDDCCCDTWQFCCAPTINPQYMDWHHQSYFQNLSIYLSYIQENPTCDCYWPEAHPKANKISDQVYEGLLEIIIEIGIPTNFTPYLINRSYFGFISGVLSHAFFFSDYRTILQELDQYYSLNEPYDYSIIHLELSDIEEALQENFYAHYTQCLEKHPHPKIYYERGMILFHKGNNLDSLEDIRRFIAYAEKHDYQHYLTSDLYLKEGRLLNESLSYDEAIVALTYAIEKDPNNSDAYFERAIAYFETGNFLLSLPDYLASGVAPTKIKHKDSEWRYYLSLTQGITVGMLQGSKEGAIEFVPSLLSSCKGLSKGLWAFVSEPIAISKDMVDAAQACIKYIIYNTTKENICLLVPELQECLVKWSRLDSYTKGHYIGHIIGKYGIDIFIGSGSMQAIKLYRNLRKANAVLTLKTAATSPKLAKEVFKQAAIEGAVRRQILKGGNLKIQWDKQGKHIKGHRNYIAGKNKSILTYKEPQKLIDEFAGTGIRGGNHIPGTPGYKEIVDFKVLIGYNVHPGTTQITPTTWGKIHYSKNGVHIVPTRPR